MGLGSPADAPSAQMPAEEPRALRPLSPASGGTDSYYGVRAGDASFRQPDLRLLCAPTPRQPLGVPRGPLPPGARPGPRPAAPPPEGPAHGLSRSAPSPPAPAAPGAQSAGLGTRDPAAGAAAWGASAGACGASSTCCSASTCSSG